MLDKCYNMNPFFTLLKLPICQSLVGRYFLVRFSSIVMKALYPIESLQSIPSKQRGLSFLLYKTTDGWLPTGFELAPDK